MSEQSFRRRNNLESGRKIFHIHLLSSSGLFRWQRRKIAAGVLSLSFSCPSPHSVFLSSLFLSIYAGLFSAFTIQFVMYRDGFSPHWCTNNAPMLIENVHVLCIFYCLRHLHRHRYIICVSTSVGNRAFAQIKYVFFFLLFII